MGNNKKILKELKDISTVVSNLAAKDPYKVPQGYFDTFPSQVVSLVKALESPDEDRSSLLPGMSRHTPYQVPEGYFGLLPGIILNAVKASAAPSTQEELQLLSPILGQLQKTSPFTLPETYFNELAAEIVSGIKALDFVNQELETLPGSMSDIKTTNVYNVPEGYFQHLPVSVLRKAKNQQKEKGVMVPFTKRILRYSVAALLTGIIALGAWMYFGEKPLVNSYREFADIKKISDEEIVKYLDNNTDAFDESTITASFDLEEEDVKELLAGLPDEELQRYLDQNSLSKDLITN